MYQSHLQRRAAKVAGGVRSKMIRIFVATLMLTAAVPLMELNWSGTSGVRIKISGRDEMIEACAESGLEVRYRYSLQLCERRRFWLDGCGPMRAIVQVFRYSPVSETFHIVSDSLGDDEPPKSLIAESLDQAFQKIESVRHVPFEYLGMDESARIEEGNSYLRARVVSDCKGERSETLNRLSSILSFGLVSPFTTDSGWITFQLVPR